MKNYILLLLLSNFFLLQTVTAQDKNDSLTKEIALTAKRFSADTSTVSLMSKLEKVSLKVNSVTQNLETKFTTAAIDRALDDIELKLKFSDAYINTADQHFSYRLLRVHSIYLEEMKNSMDVYTAELLKYNQEIIKVEKDIHEFIADSGYKTIPADSLMRSVFLSQYNTVLKKWIKADSINKNKELLISRTQSRLTNDYITLSGLYENVKVRMDYFNEHLLHAADKPLLSARRSDYSKSIVEVVSDSAETGGKIMLYYLSSHWVPVTVTILLCLAFVLWIIFIRKEYRKHIIGYVRTSNIRLKYLSSNPAFGSLLLGFSFAPFFFPTPPVIFVELLWTILGLILTVLFFTDKNISVRVRIIWSVFFIVFRVVALFNLYLYGSFEERWLLLVINLICLTLDFLILKTNREKHIFHLKRTAWVIYISALLHLCSVVFNFTGLFNLSKILTATATFSVFTAAVLRVFVDTGKEALTFQLALLKRNFPATHEKSLTRLYIALSRMLDAFAVIAWIIIFFNNLNIFDYIKEHIIFFLNTSIPIGSTSFTIGSVLLFVAIIWLSAILSKFISLLTDITASRNTGYNFLSNARLVIKLCIITGGILLAFMATGIPIDKIAIVLGALGVGIGFGLQNLVSNLVAGVMITLERPVRIGDVIEMSNHTGVIKEIGIRSIKIYTSDGSNIIIPNSDLLSQHVINWTLGNTHRRVEIKLIVDYGNDLYFVKSTVITLLKEHTLVMKEPEPSVIVKDLVNDSIELSCYFWCENGLQNALVKSNVMENIYDEFKKLSITIKDNTININAVTKV